MSQSAALIVPVVLYDEWIPMLEIKEALREIDPAIYLYGEGCDFGEVANNASKS